MNTEADIVIAQGGDTGWHEIGGRSAFTLVPDVVDLVA
ncbi:nitronate monooxygenase [Mycobacterium leprae]|nr:nitronate monooxygenase [Mycobacterium leprae]